jgi:hypothetical protein
MAGGRAAVVVPGSSRVRGTPVADAAIIARCRAGRLHLPGRRDVHPDQAAPSRTAARARAARGIGGPGDGPPTSGPGTTRGPAARRRQLARRSVRQRNRLRRRRRDRLCCHVCCVLPGWASAGGVTRDGLDQARTGMTRIGVVVGLAVPPAGSTVRPSSSPAISSVASSGWVLPPRGAGSRPAGRVRRGLISQAS